MRSADPPLRSRIRSRCPPAWGCSCPYPLAGREGPAIPPLLVRWPPRLAPAVVGAVAEPQLDAVLVGRDVAALANVADPIGELRPVEDELILVFGELVAQAGREIGQGHPGLERRLLRQALAFDGQPFGAG